MRLQWVEPNAAAADERRRLISQTLAKNAIRHFAGTLAQGRHTRRNVNRFTLGIVGVLASDERLFSGLLQLVDKCLRSAADITWHHGMASWHGVRHGMA